MNTPCRLLVFATLWSLSLTASAAVSARLEPNPVNPGEAVQLILQHDGETGKQPDLTPLKQDFDVLGRSTGSSIQIINGRMSAQTEIDLTLMPKRGGTLQVPALQWDGQTSPALTLTVSGNANAAGAPPGAAPAPGSAHVFLTTTLDQKQPYVQAAATLTVRLYTDEPLYQASLELQPSNDVLVQQLGQDSQTSAVRDGRTYRVIERKYLLFPQRSGSIHLDGPVLNAEVPDERGGNDPFGANAFFGNVFGRNPFGGMMNATRPLRVRADPLVLDVRARPASGTGHDWLPAQKVTLTETWQPDGPLHVGDPITRHLHLSALGLTASQLPDLSVLMPLPDGLRAYPDQARLNTGVQGDGVVGTRDQDIALIASRSGRYQIPALHLYWWDTTRNLQREVELPARTLFVLPGSGGVAAATVPPGQAGGTPLLPAAPAGPAAGQAAGSARWRWLSLGLGILWLGTLSAWWLSRRRRRVPLPDKPGAAMPAKAATAAGARKAFHQACHANDPHAARRCLLEWARATWPHDPPLGLQALAERLGDAGPKPLLKQLDRVCYTGGAWEGTLLAKELKALTGNPNGDSPAAPELAGLYP